MLIDGKLPPNSFAEWFRNPRRGPKRNLRLGGQVEDGHQTSAPKAIIAKLALGDLEPFASAFLSILLALVLPRVSRQHPQLLQLRAQLGVELQQRPRDSQFRCTGLPRRAAAAGCNQNIEFVRATSWSWKEPMKPW